MPRPEQIEELTVRMPLPAMQALRRMAEYFGVPCDTLVRRYVGRGIREDEVRYFQEQAFPAMEESLREEFGDDPRVFQALAGARSRLDREAPSRPRVREAGDRDDQAPTGRK